MIHPFQVGDVVYHPSYGECLVEALEGGSVRLSDVGEGVAPSMLSFTPWPAPNHVRRRRAGWWIVQNTAESERESGWPYVVHLRSDGAVEGEDDYITDPLIYLGRIPDGVVYEEIPEEVEETNAPEWAVKD